MEAPPEITDLGKVIEPYLDGGKLISYSTKYLTKPGDNYGSIMLSVSATIASPDGTKYELPLVAKLPPLTNEMFWKLFQPEVTSLRENAMYMNVSASFRQLQLDSGIPESKVVDVFAKHYGCRISLDEKSTLLDRDAVLVLENLQTSGYKPGKRQIPFDEAHIRLVLKDLAIYHALPIAMRKLQPEKYDKDIRPHFLRFDLAKNMNPEMNQQLIDQLLEEVEIALDDPKAHERCKELIDISAEYMANPEECPDGLFTTIAHFDLWINNMMIKYDESGAPSKLKFVDFQGAQYESLMHDLIFLLLSSVEIKVLEEQFYELLKFYYDEFIECLHSTSCKTDEYSYEKFLEEVQRIGKYQVHHALFMSRILTAEDSTLPKDFKEIDTEMFKVAPPKAFMQKLSDIVRLAKKYKFFW